MHPEQECHRTAILSLFKDQFISFWCTDVFSAGMSVNCLHTQYSWGPEEGVGTPEMGATDG